MLREILATRSVQGALVFVVFVGVGCLLYRQHIERENARDVARSAAEARRYEEILGRAPQDAASAEPETEGYWHGDVLIADAHPTNDGEAVETEEPEVPPTLTRSELGGRAEALPYPMTHTNHHLRKALVTEAAEDPALMQKLLPDTKEKAFETATHLANSVGVEIQLAFEEAMWQKMAALYPNDAEVLFMHSAFLVPRYEATRAEQQAYVDIWERIKRLNDEQGIPITSGLRKTHSLSQTYIDLGEYDKALQNVKEQNERLAALRSAGLHHKRMYHGLLRGSDLANATELIRRHKEKQDK